jgi:hypothetical protein
LESRDRRRQNQRIRRRPLRLGTQIGPRGRKSSLLMTTTQGCRDTKPPTAPAHLPHRHLPHQSRSRPTLRGTSGGELSSPCPKGDGSSTLPSSKTADGAARPIAATRDGARRHYERNRR